jgi:hypothetical protein
MKALFALLLISSFSAHAYDIYTANAPVPAEVKKAIRERFDKECGPIAFSIVNLNLEKFAVREESADQGFLDNVYDLSFSIQYEYWNGIDYIDLQVVYPVIDRPGHSDAYVSLFKTISGSDGTSFCNY